ncbi:hypothetical protein QC761_212550 [Podospora bellae-mahoneyi]|uniref:Uncharacterized protein n=1 Tax=Podospora bellae-mahoneyi TaxID=2093777 RepID=A0ABR0FUX3_9PEZI|nr:hypothetical protein QC761_212550 [Podospora bellae-mahoneyi]
MTEPENFDDELFADLYNDDDAVPAPKPAAAAQPVQYAAVQPTIETRQEDSYDPNQYNDYSGGGENGNMNQDDEEEEDDDDDIDFNLGNGPSTTLAPHDQQDYNDSHNKNNNNNSSNSSSNNNNSHHEERQSYSAPSAPPAHTKGPNAKEDG